MKEWKETHDETEYQFGRPCPQCGHNKFYFGHGIIDYGDGDGAIPEALKCCKCGYIWTIGPGW